MPYFFCTLVPPPNATLPALTIACPPTSRVASSSSTEAPDCCARSAAGKPIAPAPTTTTSTSRSHFTRTGAAEAACGTKLPAATPAPVIAAFLKNSRREFFIVSLAQHILSPAAPHEPNPLFDHREPRYSRVIKPEFQFCLSAPEQYTRSEEHTSELQSP